MAMGEMPAEKALWCHVVEGVGQTLEPAVGHLIVERPGTGLDPFQGATLGLDQAQAPEQMPVTGFIDPIQRDRCPSPTQRTPQRIGGAPSLAQAQDLGAESTHPAQQRGAIDAAQAATEFAARNRWIACERRAQVVGCHGVFRISVATIYATILARLLLIYIFFFPIFSKFTQRFLKEPNG